MADYLHLNKLSSDYDFILVDTCSFIAPSGFSINKNSSVEKKLERAIVSNLNFSFWINKIPHHNNIYSTEGVLKEIRNFKYKYKKSIKLPLYDLKNKDGILKLRREMSENKKNKVRLSNLLESEDRIFKMNEEQKDFYASFCEKYFFFKDKLKLSEEDLELLLTGAVLSRKNNTSIISNDFGIRNACKMLLRREDSLRNNLHFYAHMGIDFFKEKEFLI